MTGLYFPHIILAICLAISLILSVSASGVYMNPYRGTVKIDNTGIQSGVRTKLLKHAEEGLKDVDELFSKCNGIEIRELTIPQVLHYFATKQLTSLALTNCYLQRIHHMNPYLNAIIQVNPDALKQAYKADLVRAKSLNSSSSSSFLLGIPILLKDNIGTKDLMETIAGSPALLGMRPKQDASTALALRKAGAVILGKTNLSEFAMFRGTNIPSGWSGRGGQTRNAYNLGEDPSGSSSGSAVAVASNLAMASLGTETDGSLIAPASVAAICTIKPTLGTPSTKGVIPLSHSQDNVGPMTRTVFDMAIILDVLMPLVNRKYAYVGCGSSFTECLVRRHEKVMRVGILRQPFWDAGIINSPDLKYELPYLENMLGAMKSSRHFDIVDPVVAPPGLLAKISGAKELIVLSHDFKHDMNQYLANEVTSDLPSNERFTLADIIKYNELHPSVEGYNQDLLILAQSTDGLQNKTYLEAKQNNVRAARNLLNNVLIKYRLDAVMTPSEPRVLGVNDAELQDSPEVGFSVAAIAGYPSVNIPAGIGLNGVPFGVTFIGLAHTEARLLQLARAVEQLAPRRQQPLFLV